MPNAQGGGGLVTGANIVDDSISNADISSTAAIDKTKVNLVDNVGDTELKDDLIKTISVTLSSAEILGLFATPKEVIPAPGAGKVISVEEWHFYMTPGGTQYTNGGVVRLQFAGQAAHILGPDAAATIPTSITQGAANFIAVRGKSGTIPEQFANTAVQITNITSAFLAGNGTAKVYIKYRIITL